MKKLVTTFTTAALALGAAFTLSSCDVEVTEDGRMPSVDVDPGELPEVDVDVAEVKAGLKEVEVEVPKVKMEKEKIKVPTVGIEPADAGKEGDDQ